MSETGPRETPNGSEPRKRRSFGPAARGVLVAALVAILGTAAFLGSRRTDAPAPPAAPSLGGEPAANPGLAPRPVEATPSSAEEAHADGPAQRSPPRVPMEVRLEMVVREGAPKPLEILEIYCRGNTWSKKTLKETGGRIDVSPGDLVNLSTDDPRAAISGVLIRAPDPVPAVLTVRVPAKGALRPRGIVLEVVDAVSGAPLPEATFESGGGEVPRVLHADAQGGIVFAERGETGDADILSMLRFSYSHGYVSAPGHFGAGDRTMPTVRWSRLEGDVRYVQGEALAVWIDRGVWPVRLQPIPSEFEDRRVQIVDASGHPMPGVVLTVTYPPRKGDSPPQKGDFPRRWDGIRRTNADGIARFPAPSVVGLAVHVSDSLVANWVLSREGWPQSGPRTLRLPEWAEVEVTVEELPRPSVRWFLSISWFLGPAEGSLMHPSADPGVLETLEGTHHLFHYDISGKFEAPTSTARFLVPVGSMKGLQLFYDSEDEGRSPSERRFLTVEATCRGPLKISRRWTELDRDR